MGMISDVLPVKEPYPYAETSAALMLRSALERVSRERRLSLRSLAKQLGYKQATVLSHMSNGRIPIPLERATDIARAVDLAPDAFLAASVAQRAPEAKKFWGFESAGDAEVAERAYFVAELTELAGSALENLNDEQKRIIREVVLDPNPSRRWLSSTELGVVLMLRRVRPEFTTRGLDERDLAKLRDVLSS